MATIDKADPHVQTLLDTINSVWQYIGDDLISCAEEMGHHVDNEEAIECCLDADRLATLGSEEAQQIYDTLTLIYGRSQVFSFLQDTLSLN